MENSVTHLPRSDPKDDVIRLQLLVRIEDLDGHLPAISEGRPLDFRFVPQDDEPFSSGTVSDAQTLPSQALQREGRHAADLGADVCGPENQRLLQCLPQAPDRGRSARRDRNVQLCLGALAVLAVLAVLFVQRKADHDLIWPEGPAVPHEDRAEFAEADLPEGRALILELGRRLVPAEMQFGQVELQDACQHGFEIGHGGIFGDGHWSEFLCELRPIGVVEGKLGSVPLLVVQADRGKAIHTTVIRQLFHADDVPVIDATGRKRKVVIHHRPAGLRACERDQGNARHTRDAERGCGGRTHDGEQR
mmetsp:Transcript_19986/g.51051  ORF Transcript_19986/g.51051 Transcript_19986/m.51051 type:complete len:305 (+) Transcript_19986:553-1467(+)